MQRWSVTPSAIRSQRQAPISAKEPNNSNQPQHQKINKVESMAAETLVSVPIR